MKRSATILSAGKKRAFFVFTLLLPIVFLVLVELSLRLFQYGTDLSLFTSDVVNGREYYVLNPETKLRYFSRMQFNPTVAPDYFLMPKPRGTYRIFCLGGSTTVGYPYWYNGSFSTFLRDRLRRIFPDRAIEIINIGMTATMSYTVNDMARDVFAYEPDLLIVYDGHNEFYGALGIASNETLGGIRPLVKLSLRLVHLRTYQLLRDVFARVAGVFRGSSQDGRVSARYPVTLMESLARGQYIQYRSRNYLECLDIFRKNLSELKEMCSQRGVPLMLGTQASNLRDMPPFISQEPEDPTARGKLASILSRGRADWEKGSVESAAGLFREALGLDSLHAEACYMEARCLDSMGRSSEALPLYRKARDLDELRFRASGDFNEAIKACADGRMVSCADIERTFEEHSTRSIPGKNLFTEHLHPNTRGYFLIAREFARLMRENELLAAAGEWKARDTLSDSLLWAERSTTELDELIARRRTDILTSGWPFKSQVPMVDAVPPSDTLGTIVENVTRARWSWVKAHEAAAEYYIGRQEPALAAKEYTVIINQFPMIDVKVYLTLAKILLDMKELLQMREVLLSSLKIQPTLLAYRALGDISLNAGDPAGAIAWYRKLLELPQAPAERVENGYMLALAYARADSSQEAQEWLLRVLKSRPDYQPAIILLQKIKSPAP